MGGVKNLPLVPTVVNSDPVLAIQTAWQPDRNAGYGADPRGAWGRTGVGDREAMAEHGGGAWTDRIQLDRQGSVCPTCPANR
jgi:hypothetical protein